MFLKCAFFCLSTPQFGQKTNHVCQYDEVTASHFQKTNGNERRKEKKLAPFEGKNKKYTPSTPQLTVGSRREEDLWGVMCLANSFSGLQSFS